MVLWRLHPLIAISSSVLVGCCSYYIYRWWRKRQFKSIDEGFEDVSKIDENPVKKILVLGLKNAGKSTILGQLTSDKKEASSTYAPTEGFNVFTFEHNGVNQNICEIGGGDKFRLYWTNFLQDTDVLVFVVDSSNVISLGSSVREFQLLLADERLAWVPILILAHKQDLASAMGTKQVADAFDVKSIHSAKHPITVLGTQTPPSSEEKHPSLVELDRTLRRLLTE